MIDFVFIGHQWNPEGSDELRFGWQALKRQLPQNATLVQTSATSMDELWLVAHRELLAQHAVKLVGGKVLLLAHPHLALAPDTIEALDKALKTEEDHAVCWGFDSQHTHQNDAIEYATWRGLERYADKKHDAALVSLEAPSNQGRLLCATYVATLVNNASMEALQHWGVPQAYAHDFSNYHSGARAEVIHMVPLTARKVLDVGGGEGGFLHALKQSHGCETHLAEYAAQACAVAETCVDKVWQGDFFKAAISETFDCITFLDVLEHATEPWHWLERAKELLNVNGCIVASIPNVGHWSVVADLLEGRWDYAPVGIHCITHLRFFTRHSIEALFAQAGFEIEGIEATRVEPPPWWHTSGFKSATSHALNIDEDNLSAYAFLVRAKLK
jgi:2-polyprenyl-3-methyl-5-hydroxy-6-metoxy-1,4-benzoquinol methylase